MGGRKAKGGFEIIPTNCNFLLFFFLNFPQLCWCGYDVGGLVSSEQT